MDNITFTSTEVAVRLWTLEERGDGRQSRERATYRLSESELRTLVVNVQCRLMRRKGEWASVVGSRCQHRVIPVQFTCHRPRRRVMCVL